MIDYTSNLPKYINSVPIHSFDTMKLEHSDTNINYSILEKNNSKIKHLSPTDLTIIGASSGGLLALTGDQFGTLINSDMRVRVLDHSENEIYSGALSSYNGIMGNTPWVGHFSGIHEKILQPLMKSDIGQEAISHEITSPRLGRVGIFLNKLGSIATAEMRSSLKSFEIDFNNHVDHIQLLENGEFRIFGTQMDLNQPVNYTFDTKLLYLATGAKPRELNIPELKVPLINPNFAVSDIGIEKIKEICGENGSCVIIGSMHTAAAIITSLGLEHELKGIDATPLDIYNATPTEIATRINTGYKGPAVIVISRNLNAPRICFRAENMEQAYRSADELGYDGGMYVSRFKEGNEVLINSHGSLEKPHAQVMLGVYNGKVERMKIITDPELKSADFQNADLIINATGYLPAYIPLMGTNEEILKIDNVPTTNGVLRVRNGSKLLKIKGLYANGFMAPLRVNVKTVVMENLKGNLADLRGASIVGVSSSRERGKKHVEEIIFQFRKKSDD